MSKVISSKVIIILLFSYCPDSHTVVHNILIALPGPLKWSTNYISYQILRSWYSGRHYYILWRHYWLFVDTIKITM